MRWSSELPFGVRTDDGWLEPRAALGSEARAYRPGRHLRENWNSAPYGPSVPAPRWPGQGVTRQGDVIVLDVPLHSDAEGHAGGSAADTARTALYRDGVLVGENAEPGYGEFEVPPAPPTAGWRRRPGAASPTSAPRCPRPGRSGPGTRPARVTCRCGPPPGTPRATR
ncbi:hypothetical protein ACGFJ5_15430 [Micromonospora echinaurantiaca]|uniref:hypothetical protein n=1 Tax=Micromonospora echinaurantiaca TaxID=47857 RepID=UPI00371780F2